MQRLYILMLVIALSGCTTMIAPFDGVYEINKDSETPEGFSISVKEAFKVVPYTKEPWRIYADKAYYYFHPYGSNYLFWSNSTLAKKWGLKLSGNDRASYAELTNLFWRGRVLNVKKFREILRSGSKD